MTNSKKNIITLVVAMDLNRAIGIQNKLPWSLPADLKHFKELTINAPVIMGRKTFESIGRPLPKRSNIIISRQTNFHASGCQVTNSLESAIAIASKLTDQKIFIIGGGQIYQQALAIADELEITQVETKILNADAYFPEFKSEEWTETSNIPHRADDKNTFSFRFITLKRASVLNR